MYKINDNQAYSFSCDNGFVLVKNKKTQSIANFIPEVLSRIEFYDDEVVTKSVKVKVLLIDGTSLEPIILQLKGLGKVDWPNDIDIRCLLNPDFSKATEHIANFIRLSCNNVPLEKMTAINRLGTHIVEGIALFNAGDQLIWPSDIESKPAVDFTPQPNIRLVVDPDCSEAKAFEGMRKIIDLNPEAVRIIFSLNLLSIMWEGFVTAGIQPRCCVFLHGNTGAKKTTISQFNIQIYNRDEPLENPTRLTASIPSAVKILNERSDCVVLFDDLFQSQTKSITRHQEKVLLEITRIIGDNTIPARVKGREVSKESPRCGVLFTGEYYVGLGSDAARLLPVEIKTPINNDRLTECQNQPLILSTFYRYFIEWYITNFYKISDLLKEWIEVYRKTKTGIHDRLQETQFCLEAAFKLYLTYGEDKGIVSKESILKEYNSYYTILRKIVLEQNGRVLQGRTGGYESVNYLNLIRSIYHENRFKLASNAKSFNKDEHDGVLHGDFLYLRQNKLMKKLKILEPYADFDDVLKSLEEQQALKKGKNSSSKQIHATGRGLRFYVIPLSKLH